MIPYILHVSILIAAGFLFYKLALKKLTFYVLNRWVLLACLAAAFLVPLMPMPRQLSWRVAAAGTITRPEIAAPLETVATPEHTATVATVAKPVGRSNMVVRTKHSARQGLIVKAKDTAFRNTRQEATADSKIPVVPRTAARLQVASKGAVDILKILFYLYLSGVIMLALNLLRQMVMLLLQRYRSPVIRDGNYRIVTTTGMRGPCSFGNIIFIHPSEYDPQTYQQILLHEKIHAGGWHTMDILIAELGIIFQWFNPFIWLFRRELENNLEFLTDRNVLRHPGVERAAYQLSLVKVAAPDVSLNITSNYNQSLLKRRIIMMNAQNSSRHTAWKYLFLLPVFILLAGLLNRPAALAQTVRVHAPAVGKSSTGAKAPSTVTVAPAGTAATIPVAASMPGMSSDTIPPLPGDAHSVVIVSDVSDATPAVQSVVNATVTSSVTANVVAVANVSVVPEVQVTVPVAPVVAWPVSDTSKPTWVDRTEGAWFIVTSQDKKEDKVNIELRGENDDHSWNSSFPVPRSQLSSLNSVGKVDFSLTREAGSIHFTGQFDGEQGFGHYKFQPDAAYFAHMRDKKIVGREDELMTFFMLDIKRSYVDMLQANGFSDISRGHLISMAALHIDEAYIKSIRESGYSDISESQL
ncbi:MAG TPA: M56 family metallopeptidase, partial [Puia sp.]